MGEARSNKVAKSPWGLDLAYTLHFTTSEGREGVYIQIRWTRSFTSWHSFCRYQLQEAALSALASLAKDNETLAIRLAKGPPGQERTCACFSRCATSLTCSDHPAVLSVVLSLCKSRNTDMQLAASLWSAPFASGARH